jgi:hypothetical protein
MSYEPEDYGPTPEEDAARDRTNIPGILLIVVGVLNVLLGLFLLFRAVQIAVAPAQEFAIAQDQIRQLLPNLPQEQTTPEQAKTQAVVMAAVWGLAELGAAVLSLAGGFRMRALGSYGLAVAGAIVAMIPCVSCAGCCGLGEIAGIWALIVLANPDVRSAFR